MADLSIDFAGIRSPIRFGLPLVLPPIRPIKPIVPLKPAGAG